MLRINTQLITAAIVLLFTFWGCGQEDKLQLTGEEMECVDINATAPTINISGNFLEGGNATLNAVVYNVQGSGINYHWEGPNGFKSNNRDINLTNLNSTHTGNYTVYITRGGCKSKGNTKYIEVQEVPRKCNISKEDWVNIAGYPEYENMQYSPTQHYYNSSTARYYIHPKQYSSLQPKIEIALNQGDIREGEYTLSPTTNYTNVPWGGKQASLVITTFFDRYVNKTSGKLNIVRNGKGEYEVTVCDEPIESASNGGPPYLFKAKFICD